MPKKKRKPLTEDQQKLVEDHIAIVWSLLTCEEDYDPLIDALMNSARRFDPCNGAKFGTFAMNRMRFAKVDAFRQRVGVKSGVARKKQPIIFRSLDAIKEKWGIERADKRIQEPILEIENAEHFEKIIKRFSKHETVMRLLSEGSTQVEIAEELNVSQMSIWLRVAQLRKELEDFPPEYIKDLVAYYSRKRKRKERKDE